MTRLAIYSIAAAIALLLLSAGCTGGERQQNANRDDGGNQRAGARHEADPVSVAACRPTESIETEGHSSGKMVFQQFGTGAGIYSMNANGSELRRLTSATRVSDETEAEPRWSADMKKVAFVRSIERIDESTAPEYGSASPTESVNFIYTMNADGSDKRKLLDTPAGAPAWSPDGRYIAYLSVSDGAIYVTHADGSGTPKMVTNDFVTDIISDDDTDIQWSPDCKKLAFAASGIIYLANLSDEEGVTKTQRLTSKAITPASQPSWSPVGNEIAFTRGDTSTPGVPSHVYKMDADGSNVTRLTNFAWGKDLWPTWSPDGRKIAFVRVSNERDHSGEIRESSAVVVMNSDGSDAALLGSSLSSGAL
jgi:Tol biopolymer transport system component